MANQLPKAVVPALAFVIGTMLVVQGGLEHIPGYRLPTLTASEKFHVAKVDFLIYFNINTCTTTHSTQCIGKLSTYIRFWDLLSRRINYASPRFCSVFRLAILS